MFLRARVLEPRADMHRTLFFNARRRLIPDVTRDTPPLPSGEGKGGTRMNSQ